MPGAALNPRSIDIRLKKKIPDRLQRDSRETPEKYPLDFEKYPFSRSNRDFRRLQLRKEGAGLATQEGSSSPKKLTTSLKKVPT